MPLPRRLLAISLGLLVLGWQQPVRADTVLLATGDYPPLSGEEEPGGGLLAQVVSAAYGSQGTTVHLTLATRLQRDAEWFLRRHISLCQKCRTGSGLFVFQRHFHRHDPALWLGGWQPADALVWQIRMCAIGL